MLSKCANPNCCEQFRYLHLGKLFYVSLAAKPLRSSQRSSQQPQERFWLCERCAQTLTITWDGVQVRVAKLPPKPAPKTVNVENEQTLIVGQSTGT